MRRLVPLALLTVAMLAACGDDAPTTGIAPTIERAPQSRQSLVSATERFWSERFTRTSGAPDRFTRTIDASQFEAPFTLTVTNGGASSASVTLDGRELFGTRDFNARWAGDSVAVTLGASAQLSVTLASAPGAWVEVSVSGKRRGVRFCPGDASAFQELQAAVDAAPAGSTVLVCDGRHPASAVTIAKALTIRAEHPGQATLLAPAYTTNVADALEIDNALGAGEVVRIADLQFEFDIYAIFALQNAGQVVIENSSFTGRPGVPYYSVGVAVGTAFRTDSAATGQVTIRGSHFTGSGSGAAQFGPLAMHVLDNTFDGLASSAIQYQGNRPPAGATWRAVYSVVRGNVARRCGAAGCLRLSGVGNALVEDNELHGNGGPFGIFIIRLASMTGAEPIQLRNNRILGDAITGDVNAAPSYGFSNAGIHVDDATTAGVTASGNLVSKAWVAFRAQRGALLATDNTADNTGRVIEANPSSMASRFNRNDFGTYQSGAYFGPFAPQGMLGCNWWGSPHGVRLRSNPLVMYAPWALQPVAGTTLACDPATLPAVVGVCPAGDVSGAEVTVPSVRDGVDIVRTGGTVRACDGTHVAMTVPVNRSMTIEGVTPLGATIHADTARVSLSQFGSTGTEQVVIRGLRFTGGWQNSIGVNGASASVLVEGNEFHPPSAQPYGGALLGYQAGVAVFSDRNGPVTIAGNRFVGGDLGVNVGARNVTIRGNTFEDQNNAAMHDGWYLMADGTKLFGSAVFENNTVNGCGSRWCVGVFSGGDFTIRNNSFNIPMSRRVQNAMQLHGKHFLVEGNTITGTGSTGGSSDAGWAIGAGVSSDGVRGNAPDYFLLDGNGTATIRGNTISGAFKGVHVQFSDAVVTDNRISNVRIGVGVFGGTDRGITIQSNAQVHRNDFTQLAQAADMWQYGSTSLGCNYWGGQAPPAAIFPGWIPAAVFSPVATQPIAGTGNVCP